MTTETLDKAYLEYSNITNAVTAKELELQRKLEITIKALKSIKQENLDDKTEARYLKALKEWKDKTTKTSWNALKQIGVDPLAR